jgi:hypothetical protein
MCQPDFDEISQLVDRMVKERLEDEVWVNVRRHLISFRKLLYSGRKEVEPLSLRAVRVSTRKAQGLQKAALNGAAVIKDNPHLIYVRAVHERNFEPAWEDPSPTNSQKDSIVATLSAAA